MNTLNQAIEIFTSYIWGDKAPEGFKPKPIEGELQFSHTSTDNVGGVATVVRHFIPCEGGTLVGFISQDGREATVVDLSQREGYQVKGDYLVS